MPSSMVHLMIAYDYNPGPPAEFWVGNIAPDCIDNRAESDKFHLRCSKDREQALRGFAKTINKDDLFAEGILLHLFVDWKWDDDLRQQYIKYCNSGDWFQPYRNEIGLLSARLYHDNLWSGKVWNEMISSDIPKYNKTKEISSENILSILKRANTYHIDNPSATPVFYSVESVIDFTGKTAEDYRKWRNTI